MLVCMDLQRHGHEGVRTRNKSQAHALSSHTADMVEHVARLAWSAARPFMCKPMLRVAIISPLAAICAQLNRLGALDRQFQVCRMPVSVYRPCFTTSSTGCVLYRHAQLKAYPL